MRSVFICTSIVIVVSSVFSQQPLVRYSETLKKAVPHHYDHDKENADGRLDKIARGHKIEPYQPPLRPHKEIPWLRWVHEGRWAAQANKNTELHKVRARLLEEKLKPNHFVFKPHINPQLKPRLKQKGNARTKREVGETEKVHKKIDIKANVRNKRDIMMPQLLPEMIMQPHLEAKIPQSSDQKPPKQLNLHFYNPSIYHPDALEALANISDPFKGRVKESDKREKRQIVYFINRPPQLFARSPRTTPNPFIRDTHIDEYDIIRPEVGEREGMIPTIESGRSDLGSYPLVKIPQALFRFLQIAKIKIEQIYQAKTQQTNKSSSITEEAHVRVKRRMSRFVRDRKQITRKKKIGRAKKTKVKRAPVKMKKWYDKRQKVKKKGDGTYRGGRGRKPRQHKRPRHYKPPMNETSDYDYYDSKGGIRGEETPEGPDVADYLSYVSGEYSDTEEAEKAHQELEKEYQEQLKRERLLEKKRKLLNDTTVYPEKLNYVPYSSSSESKGDSDEDKGKTEGKLNKGKSREEEKLKKIKREKSQGIKENVSKRKRVDSKRTNEVEIPGKSTNEESEEEKTEEDSSEEESIEDSSEEENTEEDSSEEESTEEDSSEADSTEEDKNKDESSKEEIDEEESSVAESSGDSNGDGKRRKFPRKYRKSPRWKQGKTGKYESDPRKLENKQEFIDKGDTKASMKVKENNQYSSSKKESNIDAKFLKENKKVIHQQDKSQIATKSQASANVRKVARKFDFFSLSSYPIIRNFMATGESHPTNTQTNYMHPKEEQTPNRMSSLKFETPPHIDIQRLHSMHIKTSPDAVSLSNPNLVSRGGEHLQNLQSKRVESHLHSTFKDRKLTSIAHEKPKDTLTLISETKDERKKWTSTGSDHMGSIQSLKVDPVVLTSIARNIPELNIDKKEKNTALMKDKANTHGDNRGNDLVGLRERVNIPARDRSVLTSIAKDIPRLSIGKNEENANFHKKNIKIHRGNKENNFVNKNEKLNNQVMKQKENHESYLEIKNNKVLKREINQEELNETSFEELSSMPDSAGVSIPSDEIEPASDDKK